MTAARNGIFISYRRQDAAGHAGRLYDGLAHRFGPSKVFIDVLTLRPGVDFPKAIEEALASCDVVLAVIGPHWADSSSPDGTRRLEQPGDFVRLELASAFRLGLAVIPVLVEKATMPSDAELPEDLKPLNRRHAIEVDDARWDGDLARLIDAVLRARGPASGQLSARRVLRPGPAVGLAAAAFVVAAFAAIALASRWAFPSPSPTPSAPAAAAIATATATLTSEPTATGVWASFGALLVNDDLTHGTSGIATVKTSDCSASVSDGLVISSLILDHECASSLAPLSAKIASEPDLSVRVSATYTQYASHVTSAYGAGEAEISCRLEGDLAGGSYYTASLSANGYVFLVRYDSGEPTITFPGSGSYSQLATPVGGMRRLRFDCVDDQQDRTTLLFYVDDELIVSAVDGLQRLGAGAVALGTETYVDTPMTVTFRDVAILAP